MLLGLYGGCQLCSAFAHGVSLEIDLVGVVDQAVEDGVGQRGVSYEVVPFVDGELAGGQCRACAVAVFEDLQQVAALPHHNP